MRTFAAALVIAAVSAPPHAAATISWAECLRQPAGWYGTADAIRIAENVLAYQRDSGGWPKNIDMARPLSNAERTAVTADRTLTDSTIDNGATVTQIPYLARVFAATHDDRLRAAVVRGLDYLLSAQYANGGWPQYFPLRENYSRYITFNDDAMIGVMALLRDVSGSNGGFVDKSRSAKIADALQRGQRLILETQIRVAGRLTGWCQQYDDRTLQPAKARAYEHPSIASKETVAIVEFLMDIDKPESGTIAAIEGAVDWLRSVQIRGIRLEQRPDAAGPQGFDRVVVNDPAAPPLWTRFYEIGTNLPIYSGRDGVIRRRLEDIEIERRTGYSWLGPYASTLLNKEYPAWRKLRDIHE